MLTPGATIGILGGGQLARMLAMAGARLGLNGPEVVEQEAGIGELDARDRPLIWRLTGGARRVAQGHADRLVGDDCVALAKAVRTAFGEMRNGQRTATQRLRSVFADADEMR